MSTIVNDQAAMAKWQEISVLASRLVERSGRENGFAIHPRSPLAGDDLHSSPYHVSHAVKINIASAVDHLHGLCALVTSAGVLHLAAPATLARGALECAATAIWIACPTTRDERVTRALKWNIADIKDGDRAATAAGLPVPTSLQDRKNKVEAVAVARGLPFKPISGGYKILDDALASADAYLQSPLHVSFPWQLASGFAHGRRWSTLAFADTMEKKATSQPGVVNIKMENDLSRVLYLGLAAALAVQGAVRLYELRGTAP
ncbi:hypothetical protein [Actinokineospora globicatena]|uniref:Uncharacterized protein n=1 Tax=Actinokineospora globicatena TaxID=103729 RepID=A0A9W6QKF3_9PSEU|nr:hypothetical protein [Actinokineospora globicatena]GLW90280.1 hypothetical protein Aglo03_10960 [Actinokineospora globicatena]